MGQDAVSWKENWQSSWQMFMRVLPLLLFWFLLTGCVLILIPGIPSIEPLVRRARFPARSQTLVFTNTSGLATTLCVSFPQEISADPLLIPSQVVSMHLVQRDDQDVDEASIVGVESSGGGLALVDRQGRPFPQPARWVVPTDTLTSPMHFHLCPASALGRREISLRFRVLGGVSGTEQSDEKPQLVSLTVEPAWQTWLFRVAASVSQSGTAATGVVSLLTALAGFGVREWVGKLAEEERQSRQIREEPLAEIESLRGYLRNERFDEALECYEELRDKKRPPWQDEIIQERLRMVWRKASPPELQSWVLIRGCITQEDSQGATRLEAEQ